MRKRLSRTKDWHELARKANWSPAELAQACEVSMRTLERYFQDRMDKGPHVWLAEKRMARARELLTEGFSVRQTARELGYDSPQHFARQFKKRHGHCPCMHAALCKVDAGGQAKSV